MANFCKIDATPYQWFKSQGDGQYYALHGIIDDATSKILALYMTQNECQYGYMACRRQVINKYGIEVADYTDRSPVFSQNYKERELLTIEEQLGGGKKTPLWESMNKELGITLHLANSPQAKGKIERAWGTIQKRLPYKLQQKGLSAQNLKTVNEYLMSEFIDYYNEHFGKEPKKQQSLFRQLSQDADIDNILSAKTSRMIRNDGTISYLGLKLKVVGLKYFSSTSKTGQLCINENDIFFVYDNHRYSLKVQDGELSDASEVLTQIINDTLFKPCHEHFR